MRFGGKDMNRLRNIISHQSLPHFPHFPLFSAPVPKSCRPSRQACPRRGWSPRPFIPCEPVNCVGKSHQDDQSCIVSKPPVSTKPSSSPRSFQNPRLWGQGFSFLRALWPHLVTVAEFWHGVQGGHSGAQMEKWRSLAWNRPKEGEGREGKGWFR